MAQDATLQLNSNHKMPVIGLGTWQAPAGQVGAAGEAAVRAPEARPRPLSCPLLGPAASGGCLAR